ncbi:hypothetical protein BP5796_01386 [Coleophoma crateriformis]|uniref:ISWI chromatin-remodeling complex ATPase ISW2 n=1 Tax=Coleophoma crateriformis TaxID=565419 RepID=A0A3D8T097_9HELO|nr:hypothetical protein BP5796_01386 [Coleophoma crateriformis]
MASTSGDDMSRLPTSTPSSPADDNMEMATEEEQEMIAEEKKARIENEKAEERRRKIALKKRKNRGEESKADREMKAKQLEDLLAKSAAFSNVLTKKTEVLGRVGSGFDGKALGEHDLQMAEQPGIMVGGTMRDYQLEGLTWMYELTSQGMSGVLADEMGLGKTIQTIALIALLREKENYLGPHLIIAPLSTLSNWDEEFGKWTPSIPIMLYHGNPKERMQLRKNMMKHLVAGRPNIKFPVVLTSPEIILRDRADLAKVNWELIIIDEGHRMKNSEAKLFRDLQTFTSATRLLITGTPLQNNLKELWSLLHFLLPTIFSDWDAFESWFDFSDLHDEEGTQEFLADKKKQDLVKKIHLILQPLLLRRVKADVEHMLPKKREYVLFAPMTREQTDLYNTFTDKNADPRKYLEDKVVERLTNAMNTPATSRIPSPTSSSTATRSSSKVSLKNESDSEDDDIPLMKVALRSKVSSKNAFEQMMARKGTASATALGKRKSQSSTSTPSKSNKSSRQSTPRSSIRGRTLRGKRVYKEADASDEDQLSDDDFEAKLADELTDVEVKFDEADQGTPEEIERAKTLDLAKKEIGAKKLGNTLMQLRLACNSPHHFYNPWPAGSGLSVDESLVTSSGKMLLLDRLLPYLFDHGHKVLIFSQFKIQLDILEDYARDLRNWKICRIDGGVAQDSRRQQIKDFNEDPETRLFLLSTRAGGQGINLATADTVILFDSDWNPQQDLQAQDRAHRIGQTKPVVVFRLATKDTVEEELLLSADAKRRLEKLVIKKGGFKSMGQKMDGNEEDMTKEQLRSLLLKDGEVYQGRGKDEILSNADLEILCDRSDAAYSRAEKGLGDADMFKVMETKVGGFMTDMK